MTQESVADSILVGVDGSAPSNHAVDWAADEARQRGSGIHLVHAFPDSVRGSESDRVEIRQAAENLLSTAVERAVRVLGEARVSQEVLDEPTDQALVNKSESFPLLVVGSRGHGGFASLLLGSTSANLASHAFCPVAVVRGPTEDADPAETTPHAPIVVGADDSPWTQRALEFAFARAAERGAPIIAVSAWHAPPTHGVYAAAELIPADTDDLQHDVSQGLAEALEPWQRQYPDVEVEQRVVGTHAVTALVEASHGAQFLVVGSRGRGTLKGMLLGSVSHGALHHARSTVIVAR